jgi:hypothetical protein
MDPPLPCAASFLGQVISVQQPRDASGRPAYKTLRRGHANICSAVAFRPHRCVSLQGRAPPRENLKRTPLICLDTFTPG